MNDLKRQARKAGWLYWLACAPAPFAFLYVPNAIMVKGDAASTAEHVRASGTLVRLAIAGELWNAVVIVFALVALYRLFRGVSERLSLLMVILFLVSVPVLLVNPLNYVAALILAGSPASLSSFDPRQLDALAYLFLRLHGQGLIIGQIFWGLWLFPFGLVVMRSGFIPRVLGVFAIVAGVGYVVASLTTLMAPAVAPRVAPFALALGVGEIPITLWLMFWGAREKPAGAEVLAPQGT